MKELTIEQKAKAYDEARKKIAIRFGSNVADEIFSQFEMSEDERIRKSLIGHLKECRNNTRSEVMLGEYAKWIAWLEKQAEHKKFRDSIQVGDKVTRNKDGVLVNLSQLKRVAKKDEKQGKQSKNEDKGILHRFSFYSYKDEPNILYLAGLYVDDEYRNKGIGTKILKVANEVAASMKCNSIRLKTEKGSHAEKLYRENGYTTILEEENQIWLEKQGEQKSIQKDTETQDLWVYIKEFCDKFGRIPKDQDELEALVNYVIKRYNPADKIEPKFKVGDWAVSKFDGKARQISEVHYDEYNKYYVVGTNGYDIEKYDRLHHLWTIQDAKAGDVLTCYSDIKGQPIEQTGIIKQYVGRHGGCSNSFKAYFGVDWDNNVVIEGYMGSSNIYPATKEQRDLLFQKMKEAGYEWDNEKKELKKIIIPKFKVHDCIIKKHNSDINSFGSFTITDITGGKYWYNDRVICDITEQNEWEIYEPIRQKPAEWSKEDEKVIHCLEYTVKHFYEDEYTIKWCCDWLKSLKDRVQPKQEWSEEDKKHIHSIISTIECCKAQYKEAIAVREQYDSDLDWLKSIRPQKQWKPSDLPHWKKSTLPNDNNTTGFNSDYFCHKGYIINYKELFEKLPKDD